ncbi:MAG: chromate efflux transporter [Actinomycetota bacterium]
MEGRVAEVARAFLKLGTTAFGGPAVHVSMMHDEFVTRRRWLDDQTFLDLVGATNLIPGPNSTEMAIHLGFTRARWRGLVTAGACFILPATVIVLVLAVIYVHYGSTPQGRAVLYGIAPVVIAVIFQALIRLGRAAIKDAWLGAIGVAALALYLLGVSELVVLFGGALVAMVIGNAGRLGSSHHAWVPWVVPGVSLFGQVEPQRAVDLGRLFLVFLKVGALLYGSGYVLLAFLRSDLVHGLGWLTEGQLIDAVAVGQMTPGPLLTAATFIGYLLSGFAGAVIATIGIVLPSFVFVAALQPVMPRIRRSVWAGAALDGVNVAALGLMAGVTYQLGRRAVVDIPTGVLAVAAAVAVFRFRINSAWLVLAGAAVGGLIVWLR